VAPALRDTDTKVRSSQERGSIEPLAARLVAAQEYDLAAGGIRRRGPSAITISDPVLGDRQAGLTVLGSTAIGVG
jgi:hypothetical protein